MLNEPIKIGKLTIPNRTILAPLAGVSDPPFRRICTELGAGLTFVEMLSADALMIKSERTMEMLYRHPSEAILGVQVTGPTPLKVAQSVQFLDEQGFDIVDINMGCPVRKIVGSGLGCAFMKDPQRVSDTVAESRAATRKPLSVKFRLGFERKAPNVEDIAQRVAFAGADMITIHGRFRDDSYATPVDYAAIQRGFAATERPVVKVGNGNVMDYESGRVMVEGSGCDAVMVSRGALGDPWIFKSLLEGRDVVPTIAEWADTVLRHIDYHGEHHGPEGMSALRLRKHLLWYASGFPKTNRIRNMLNNVSSMAEARDIIRSFAAAFPQDLLRYENPDRDIVEAADPKYQMDRNADRAAAEDGLAAER